MFLNSVDSVPFQFPKAVVQCINFPKTGFLVPQDLPS